LSECPQYILAVFDGSIKHRSQDSKLRSTVERFEIARDFVFDFDVTYSSFRTIIVGWNIGDKQITTICDV